MEITQFNAGSNSNGLVNAFHIWSFKKPATGANKINVFQGQENADPSRCNLKNGLVPSGIGYNAFALKISALPKVGTPLTLANRQKLDDILTRSYIEFTINGNMVTQLSLMALETTRPGVSQTAAANPLIDGSGVNPPQWISFGSLPHQWATMTQPEYELKFGEGQSWPAELADVDVVFTFEVVRKSLNASQIQG